MKRLGLALLLFLLTAASRAAPINVYQIVGPGGLIDPSLLVQYLAQPQTLNAPTISGTLTVAPGPILNGDGNGAAPSYAFASEPGLGLERRAAGAMELAGGGVSFVGFRSGGAGTNVNTIVLKNTGSFLWSADGNINLGGGTGAGFYSGSVNTIDQRNGTSAQTFNLYNTFTDASNYERLGATWSGNVLTLAAQAAGTGTQRRIDIVGTPTNDSAPAGVVGELLSATVATGSSVSLTTATTANITSVSLTAGDWDCSGTVDYTFGATTNYTGLQQGISTTSATLGAQDTFTSQVTAGNVPTAAIDMALPTGTVRVSLAGTTTVFLVAKGTFTVSTLKGYGTIRCRRVR